MSRKNIFGICHICGNDGKLSYEHVPPEKAFNNMPVIEAKFEDIIRLGPNEKPKGHENQRGSGSHTLCEKCNNLTGHWYGTRFIDWCYQGMNILTRAERNPTLYYLNYVFPLAIIKQIVTMFFSTNGVEFRDKHPELVEFVLNKNKRYLSPLYRFFIYYNISSSMRSTGIVGHIDILTRSSYVYCEISHPPYGYIMTLGSDPPKDNLMEITHFSRFPYNDFRVMNFKIPVLPVQSWFPADYRTKDEILKDYDNNMDNEVNLE